MRMHEQQSRIGRGLKSVRSVTVRVTAVLVLGLMVPTGTVVHPQPVEVSEQTDSIYLIAKAEGKDQDAWNERWVLVFKPGYLRQQCGVVRYRNGQKDRCIKIDEDGSVYNALGMVVGSIAKGRKSLTLTYRDGTILLFSLFEGSLQAAVAESSNSPLKSFDSLIKKDTPSIKRLLLDGKAHVGKEVTLHGYGLLLDYYNYGYLRAESTHYCVRVDSAPSFSLERIHVYFRKEKFPGLLDRLELLGKAGGGKKIRVRAILLAERFDEPALGYEPMLEGLDYQILE